jgi:hypothetical protein
MVGVRLQVNQGVGLHHGHSIRMIQNSPPSRFEKNAPGPFYTTGDCLFCGAPEEEASELLAPLDAGNYDTYFVRQPATPEEVEHACCAAEVCCVSAVRYAGTDPGIIRRLGNRVDTCDHLLPGGPIQLPWERDDQWQRLRRDWLRSSRRWWQFWRR